MLSGSVDSNPTPSAGVMGVVRTYSVSLLAVVTSSQSPLSNRRRSISRLALLRAVRIGQLPARPKNTTTARPSLTMSWSARRPIRSPSLERGTVVTLSTIKLLASRRPL